MLHRFTVSPFSPSYLNGINLFLLPPPQVAEITMVDFGVRPMDADEELKVSLIKWFYNKMVIDTTVHSTVCCVLCVVFLFSDPPQCHLL